MGRARWEQLVSALESKEAVVRRVREALAAANDEDGPVTSNRLLKKAGLDAVSRT